MGTGAWIYRGAVTLVLAAGSMLDQSAAAMIEAAAAAGFDGVGLRVSSPATEPNGIDDVDSVRQLAAHRGIVIHDAEVYRIGSPVGPHAVIDRAAAVGAASVLVVSDVAGRDHTLRALDEIVRIADPLGLRIALEYMAWTYPSTPLEAIDVALASGCEVVVDVLHHVRVGAGTSELQAVVASGTLAWVQLCDAPLAAPSDGDLIGEARHGRLLPGAGELPLADLLACVPDRTTVSVEVQSDALSTLDAGVRAALLYEAARSIVGR